jgi:hypothetical protein
MNLVDYYPNEDPRKYTAVFKCNHRVTFIAANKDDITDLILAANHVDCADCAYEKYGEFHSLGVTTMGHDFEVEIG